MAGGWRYHVMLVVDIEGFSRHADPVQQTLRVRLYEVMESALEAAGVFRQDVRDPEDRGDGLIWVLPSWVSEAALTGRFTDRLHAGLRERAAEEGAIAMRLRVSLHAGEVLWDGRGWVGSALNTACRLLDAQPLRDALTSATAAPYALIISRRWHELIGERRIEGFDWASCRKVPVDVKEFHDFAWIYVPGPGSDPDIASSLPRRIEGRIADPVAGAGPHQASDVGTVSRRPASPCGRPGCHGFVDETGYCDDCGLPAVPARVPAPAPVPVNGQDARRDTGRPKVGRRMDGVVPSLPFLSSPDPESRIQRDPRPPRNGRVCGKNHCSERVGVPVDGRPGPHEGYCPRCGTPFSFKPRLQRGDLVGDQYEVVGCLDHGGLGWVYLAKDKHLDDNLVALKGLINTNDLDALEMAVNERRFLTRLDHPNIVGIVNFVGHLDPYSGGQTGYIVMEYVGGLSLREIKETARKGGRPFGEPLRAEHVLAYGIEILAAFEYLHDQGLLYCDMKPDNAIHIRNQIKLIDLAAVRRIGDRTSPVIGTRGYQPPDEEIRTLGPSVESDIHALGRTLGELFEATTDFSVRGRSNGGGGRSHGDGGARLVVESCRRVVKRAAHPDPGRRFRSAAHMGAELREVQREILSLRDGRERPGGSARFAPPTVLLDAGLGQVPSLGRWTTPGGEEATRDGDALQRLPAAPRGAARLQAPLPDPDDPGADLLDDVDGGSRARSLDDLLNFRGSAGIALRLCREYLEPAGDSATTDHLDKAKAFLESAASLLPAGSSDWRVVWHRGLLALARGRIDTALTWFDRIYDEMPGEEAPKLAIGFCKEHQGALDEAEGYYEAVWRRNRSQVNAAFALARIWLHRARRKEAVEVLEEVPQTSRHYDAARIAMVRIHLGRLAVAEGDGRPTAADFDQVLRRLADLDLDGGTGEGESSDRLVALVRETALGRLAEVEHGDGREILGDPVTERTLRTLLEQSYRRLARQARGPKEYELLIDRANDIRPWTLL